MPRLDQGTTGDILHEFGRKRRCLAFKQLAERLGYDPPESGTQGVTSHLKALTENQQGKEPCRSAIVVAQGDLPRNYVAGPVPMKKVADFAKDARSKGYCGPSDDAESLREQLEKVFKWAEEGP
jgi:hypothetical protein